MYKASAPDQTPAAAGVRLHGLEQGLPGELLQHGQELFDSLAHDPTPALRWYVASQAAIVRGRGQAATAFNGPIEVVSRFTGGGAVLMDEHLLSLDVLLPAGHAWLEGGIGEVFMHVGKVWAQALAELGVRDLTVHEHASAARQLGDRRERLLADICFALPGRGEVLHQGRKLVGLSQRRRRHGAIVQCGLLRQWQPQALLAALGAKPNDTQVHAAAVGLDTLLQPSPDAALVIAKVEQGVIRALQG